MRKELEDLYKTRDTLIKLGLTVDQALLDKIAELEAMPESDTPIYDLLVKTSKHPVNEEKKACIYETVEELLADVPNTCDPGLLLGRIQCGKTDTFEKIIGLAFDRGVDVAVVLTKGTNALLKQTVSRLNDDYASLDEESREYEEGNPKVHIFDIHTLSSYGIHASYLKNGQKVIIVCMKQAVNMEYLISLFTEKSPHLLEKKILVVDDEADFASRNYLAVKSKAVTDEDGNPMATTKDNKLAVISAQIDKFRDLTKCKYLQVTATPYALYLQPGDEIFLQGNRVLSFKPRFTKLVPTHSKYVGGKQFFEESQNDDSMYHELYVGVQPECIKVLNDTHGSYLNKTLSSKKLYGLTYAVVSYLMATAIRNFQEGKDYNTSALFHVDISKNNHDFQKNLIDNVVNFLRENIINGNTEDKRLIFALDEAYDSFKLSHQKAVNAGQIDIPFPSKDEVWDKLKFILSEKDYIKVQIVNSDENVTNLLNKDGELQLHPVANIFIGGNILDRGITIKNMLCFFYGRNPQSFQADTVLQHARFYGTRPNEDLVVTRLHTTPRIYDVMKRLHNMDEDLRKWFEEGKDKEESSIVFVGYDKNINPCASSKIKVSKTVSMKKHQRILPVGFQVGTKTDTEKIMKEIKKFIISLPNVNNKDENGFFEISKEDAAHLLDLIKKTYIYSKKFDNTFFKNGIDEVKGAIDYCVSRSKGKMYALIPEDERNISRIRKNGYFIDSPDGTESERRFIKDKASDCPVLLLIPEKGDKMMDYIDGSDEKINIGWQGAPFYWPVLYTQGDLNNVMFATDTKENGRVVTIDVSSLMEGIVDNDVLKLTYRGDLESRFGNEGEEREEVEHRIITKNTASRYIYMQSGKPEIKEGVFIPEDKDFGVYTRINGDFPFVLKPWKYLLLRNGRSGNCDLILLEIDWNKVETEMHPVYNKDGDIVDPYDTRDVNKRPVIVYAKDIRLDKDLNEKEVKDDITLWQIDYAIKRVVKFFPRTEINWDEVKFVDDDNSDED